MEIEGLHDFIKTFDKASDNLDKEAEKALGKVALRLLGMTKLRTPTDTGQLKNSWRISMPGKLERKISNNCEYANHVEYGHRTRNKKSVIDGRYMLTKSIEEIEKDLGREFDVIFDNLFK